MDWYYCHRVRDGKKHLVARSSELWSLRRFIERTYRHPMYWTDTFIITTDRAGKHIYEYVRRTGEYYLEARKPRSRDWIEITELGERVGTYPYTRPKDKKVTIEIYGK